MFVVLVMVLYTSDKWCTLIGVLETFSTQHYYYGRHADDACSQVQNYDEQAPANTLVKDPHTVDGVINFHGCERDQYFPRPASQSKIFSVRTKKA